MMICGVILQQATPNEINMSVVHLIYPFDWNIFSCFGALVCLT